MTPLRTGLAIFCVFVTIWITDFLTHGVLLANDYGASLPLWRPSAEMMSYLPWMNLGQLIEAAAITLLYVRGFAQRRCLREAVLFGLLMGLYGETITPIFYAVQPLPADLCVKWFVSGTVQGVVVGLVLFAVCRLRAESAPAPSP